MNLYLDDDSAKASLASLLRAAGHRVVIPADAGLAGVSDPRHLTRIAQQGLVLMTKNHDDFEDLHLLIRATCGSHFSARGEHEEYHEAREVGDGFNPCSGDWPRRLASAIG